MVEHIQSLKKEIIRINNINKSVDIDENVLQEKNECKTTSNESLKTVIMINETIIKEATNEMQFNHCDMCNHKCKSEKTMLKHLNSKHENL